MAFCAYCGKQIADGEICSCQQQTANQNVNNGWQGQPQGQPQQQQQGYYYGGQVYGQTSEQARQASAAATQAASQYASQAGNILNESLGHLLLILKAPADAAKSFVVSANAKVSAALILIHGIFAGLFALCIALKINSLAADIQKEFVSGASYLGVKIDAIDIFSVAKTFFITLIMTFVFALVYALLAWGIAAISKGHTSFQQMLAVAGVRSACLVPVSVISIVIFFVSPVWGVILFYVLGMFLSCILLVESLRVIPGINENIKTYISVLAMIIFCGVAGFGTGKAFPSTFSSDLSDFVDDFVDEMGDVMEDLDFDDLIDDIIESAMY